MKTGFNIGRFLRRLGASDVKEHDGEISRHVQPVAIVADARYETQPVQSRSAFFGAVVQGGVTPVTATIELECLAPGGMDLRDVTIAMLHGANATTLVHVRVQPDQVAFGAVDDTLEFDQMGANPVRAVGRIGQANETLFDESAPFPFPSPHLHMAPADAVTLASRPVRLPAVHVPFGHFFYVNVGPQTGTVLTILGTLHEYEEIPLQA